MSTLSEMPEMTARMSKMTRMITEDDYRNAIRKQYLDTVEKDGCALPHRLTPAEIGKLSARICGGPLTQADADILSHYYQLTGDRKSWKGQIEAVLAVKLRPAVTVFDGTKRSRNEALLDLCALLVNFQPRPFRKFRRSVSADSEETVAVAEAKSTTGLASEGPAPGYARQTQKDAEASRPGRKANYKKKATWVLTGIAVLASSFLLWKKSRMDSGACMQWQADHYERTSCAKGSGSAAVLALDTAQFSMKRLSITDTTTFFRHGRPVVWYVKYKGECEYFTAPGYHPEHMEKQLRPISTYMAQKALAGLKAKKQ